MATEGRREPRTVETLPKPSWLDSPFTQERLIVGALIFALIVLVVAAMLTPEGRGFWLGISVFVLGWIFTAAINIRSRVKQHTFDLILRTRFEATFLESIRHVTKNYKDVDVVSSEDARVIWDAKAGDTGEGGDGNKDKIKLRQHIGNVLNYYEIISISIYYKDADESLLREYFNDLIIYHFEMLQNYFTLWREENPEAFVYLEWLYRRWSGNDDALPQCSSSEASQ